MSAIALTLSEEVQTNCFARDRSGRPSVLADGACNERENCGLGCIGVGPLTSSRDLSGQIREQPARFLKPPCQVSPFVPGKGAGKS